jgi:hypothetical protein
LEGNLACLALEAARRHYAQPRRRVYIPVASFGVSGWPAEAEVKRLTTIVRAINAA